MIYLIAFSAAGAAALFVLLVAQLVPAGSSEVKRRVREVGVPSTADIALQRRQRREQRNRLEELMEILGRQLRGEARQSEATRELLVHAGYRSTSAPAIYWGTRVATAVALVALGSMAVPILGAPAVLVVLIAVYLGSVGYILPLLIVRSKARRRMHDILLALPDTLDLLVVCVEAGLGLNQAFVRVADEIRPLSRVMGDELHLLNLEIRAGRPRNEALKNLHSRTGVEDIRALALMLIQADRFGTSIATALRVHSDTLRDKRRQRAEEAAAKTTIKMVFPLVLCIFPAMFVVLVGPGFIQIAEALAGVGN
jgi:tight adherence protein C